MTPVAEVIPKAQLRRDGRRKSKTFFPFRNICGIRLLTLYFRTTLLVKLPSSMVNTSTLSNGKTRLKRGRRKDRSLLDNTIAIFAMCTCVRSIFLIGIADTGD